VTTCFDTSALFKLLVLESDSAGAVAAWNSAADPAASVIGYVELRAALARAHHAGRVPSGRYADVHLRMEEAWREVTRVYLDDAVVVAAGRLAERHALTALDAIHLASALSLREPGEDVALVTFDRRLAEAALAEGLTVLPEVA
jgi:uncharacterized protein